MPSAPPPSTGTTGPAGPPFGDTGPDADAFGVASWLTGAAGVFPLPAFSEDPHPLRQKTNVKPRLAIRVRFLIIGQSILG